MQFDQLYSQHLSQLDDQLQDALGEAARAGVHTEGVLFHAGSEDYYFADDRLIPFQPAAHYRRWVPPLSGPNHAVLARPGRKPLVLQVQPPGFWYDHSPPPPSHWQDAVELMTVSSLSELKDSAESLARIAYIGPDEHTAAELGIEASLIQPNELILPLDWHRATKTPYEIALTRMACEHAARGHLKARELFFDGASERQIHWAYQEATDHLEWQIPYETIIAFDTKGAILHYQHKRGEEAAPGNVLLLDAGAQHHGYAADITRTWVRDSVPAEFHSLRSGLETLERQLVAMVAPGRSYVDIHLEAHRLIAQLVSDHGLVKMSVDELVDKKVTRAFMPHGIGHHLGLQVHDVGGHQSTKAGGTTPPPDEHVLRNTRTVEPGHMLTVEPGIYFITSLLEHWRQGTASAAFDWPLIDRLTPFGGIRMEDDVVCTEDGYEDLTRDLIEGNEGNE